MNRQIKFKNSKNTISTAVTIFLIMILSGLSSAAMMPETTPHFFGPYPNWANSPMPTGSIVNITLTNGGAGYINPVIVIGDAYNTGSGATATLTFSNGSITGIALTNGGTGYTAPIINIYDSTGAGANATATATIGGTLNGGIRKFVDSLPGLNAAGNSTLGKYIPIAVADTTTFPASPGYPGADYYELAIIEFEEKMHTDLPPTKWRGYVQLETTSNSATSKHIPLTYLNGSPILKLDGTQAIAYDNPHYLGPIIIATKDRPTRIKFTNYLPTGTNGDLFIPVDKTVMGAGMGTKYLNGSFCNPETDPMGCASYTENRATLHLHGGLVPWISDGTAQQWTVPANENTPYQTGDSTEYVPDMWFLPNGNIIPGTLAGQTTQPVGFPTATNNPGAGSMTFYYPNQESARLMFYHDHSFGITRLNVYAGEASGYLVTDPVEQDLISGTDATGVNPTLANILPGLGIPLILQDKTFVDNTTIMMQDPTWTWGKTPGVLRTGDLWMPHVYIPNQNPYDPTGANPFGRWDYGPWFFPPTTNLKRGPVANPYYDPVNAPWEPPMIPGVPNVSMAMEAFMDTPVINGQAYPYLDVDPKAYRFRILNAANDRFFNLHMYVADSTTITSDGRNNTEVKMIASDNSNPDIAHNPTEPDPATQGPNFIQIGTEGGFLPEPTIIPNQPITWNANKKTFNMGNVLNHALLLGAAERADVIVDFSQYAGKTIIVYNDAPAAFPAKDPRNDYGTGQASLVDIGGAPTTQAGFGPNTRTIMQFRVRNITPNASFDFNALKAAFAKTPAKLGVFEVGQDPILITQDKYNTAYDKAFPTNAYVGIADENMTFKTLTDTVLTIPFKSKAIHDEMGGVYDEYGRLSGMLGLELPIRVPGAANFIGYAYLSPPVDLVTDSMTPMSPVLADGTQIWRITHNGIDTHPIHFHLFNVQLINRVAWDNSVMMPDPNELGWKETVRVNPLEDTIVALRPVAPVQPFDLPNSIRLLDPTMPEGTIMKNGGIMQYTDPTGVGTTITNHYVNFGWEYVWHCHILGHEEMDMMHSIAFSVAPKGPTNLAAAWTNDNVSLSWTDNAISDTNYTIQRSNYSSGPWNTIAVLSGNNRATGAMNYTDIINTTSTKYAYRVLATNIVGDTETKNFPVTTLNSLPSNVVEAGTGAICFTTADIGMNNNINQTELDTYVMQWKSGNVTMDNLLLAMSYWKKGVGC